jgi:hypothetical protein
VESVSSQTPAPVTGQPGELLERLASALTVLSDSPGEAFDYVSLILAVKLHLMVEPKRHGHEAFIGAVVDRLREAVSIGIGEDLLVIGVRDTIDLDLRKQTTGSDETDSPRAEARRRIERILEDQTKLEKYVELAREAAPGAVVTEDEVREHLGRMLERGFPSHIDTDGVMSWWSTDKAWTDVVALYLSDEAVNEWVSRNLRSS